MLFLNGWLWVFLPLAVIPIILHLLTLFRLRTVELSTYRFLFDSYVQQRRRMQFLEALLAMLRTLFLLGLVLFFMRPAALFLEGLSQRGAGGRDVILLMDCSASMDAKTAGTSSFDRAKAKAREVVKGLKPEDRVTLIRVAARSDALFSHFTSEFATDAIDERIDNLSTTPGRANFFAAFTQLFGPEAPPRINPVVYVFTDCQASGWKEVDTQGLEHILPAELPLVVVNVGSSEGVPNQAVIGDAPRGGRAVVGLPVYLNAKVVNYSKQPADLTLNAFVGGKEIARHKLSLKPGEIVTKRITYIPDEPGIHRGRFKISGDNGDRFPDDDEYLFVLSVIPRIRVVVVNGSPSMDLEQSETAYLKALAEGDAPDEPKPPVGARSPDRAPTGAAKDPDRLGSQGDLLRSLDLREIPEVGLNADVLKGASVVILANCGGLNAQHFLWLRDFVAAGGGLLVFPGDKVINPDLYNTQFFAVPGVPGQFLVPVQLGQPQGDPAKLETFERLESIDFSHPVMTVFDDPKREVPYFKRVLFYRYFPLTAADPKAKLWPLAEFRPGPPVPGSPDQKGQPRYALVESDYGDGRVVVAAFPVSRQWSNLPTDNGKEFVPLMLRLISRVQHRPELEAPLAVAPDGIVEISVTGAWAQARCTVSDAKDHPAKEVELNRSGSRLLGAYEHTGERGYYTIEAGQQGGEVKKGAFVVNLASEESDFTMLGEKELQKLLPSAEITLVDASAEAQQLQVQSKGLNLEKVSRWLIWLVIGSIFALEFLMATLGGRRRDPEENQSVAERIRQLNPANLVGRMTGAGAGREKAEE
jgi:hypothetical protein